jgi:hypothetical protein
MKLVKEGSRWSGGNGKKFLVLSVVERDNHIWVYYRDDHALKENREYSCYLESFLQRFREIPE